MKRFWSEVTIAALEGGHGVYLDGRPLRTPARAPLLLPTLSLAQAIAHEWAVDSLEIDPLNMPLTGLANAAIDLVSVEPQVFAGRLAAYAETDLLCYRASYPKRLVDRQQQCWEPLLATLEQRLDSRFHRTSGLMHIAQPETALRKAQQLFASYPPFTLAALDPVVTITGSAVLGLLLAEKLLSAEAAFTAATLDERWQEEQWGADSEAAAARNARQTQFEAAARFLELAATAP